MRNLERSSLWILLFATISIGTYVIVKLREDNQDLRSALHRAHQNQEQLNENFRQFSKATEQHLSKQAGDIQNINSRIGFLRANRDLESGAVVWD